MAKYIDAEALGIGRAKREAFTVPEYADGWNSAIDIINNAPVADVQEVVRCKDCKYLNDRDDNLLRWCDKLICGTVKDDFFCADGARINGEENENENQT